MSELTALALSLGAFAQRSSKAVGTALGKGADDIRDAGRSEARAKGWSPETVAGIYSRRERQGPPAAYVFVKGPAAYQETGTSRHPAQPVVTPHVDRLAGSIAADLAERVARDF